MPHLRGFVKFPDGKSRVYKTWETERRDGWVVESNILDVIAGIGLSWLSHIDDKSMSWDRFFLMS